MVHIVNLTLSEGLVLHIHISPSSKGFLQNSLQTMHWKLLQISNADIFLQYFIFVKQQSNIPLSSPKTYTSLFAG